MKKFSLVFTLLFSSLIYSMAGSVLATVHIAGSEHLPGMGTLLESLKVESKIMGKEMAYSIYLPEGYDQGTMKYPVLYLLHGYSDDETGWVKLGQVQYIADEAIRSGDAVPMIIVIPDAQITWYINSADGSQKYEDYFIGELMPYIEAEYRVRKGKENTAVSGLSMGGYGSLMMGLRHPELFAAVGALSSGVFTDDEIISMGQAQWDRLLGVPYGEGLEGEARLTGNYQMYSPGAMIELYRSKNQKVKFYIDCGDDDFLILGNMELHALMLKAEIPHEFRVRDGAHTWTYWRAGLEKVMPWVSAAFLRS